MANFSRVLHELEQEQKRMEAELERINHAINALRGVSSNGKQRGSGTGRRTLSAAARRRIAQAQKARWAKWKAQRAKKAA
jgi:hypothetical protein